MYVDDKTIVVLLLDHKSPTDSYTYESFKQQMKSRLHLSGY